MANSFDQAEGQQQGHVKDNQLILSGKSLLIIDDNPNNLSVAEKTFSKFVGASAFTAFSAKEGLQTFHTQTVNLIRMDLHMPRIDAHEATKMIREAQALKDSPIPILAYTTYNYDEVSDVIKKYHLDGNIGKPFTQTHVLETILSVIN